MTVCGSNRLVTISGINVSRYTGEIARGRTRCRRLDNFARTTPLTIWFFMSLGQDVIRGRLFASSLSVVVVVSESVAPWPALVMVRGDVVEVESCWSPAK